MFTGLIQAVGKVKRLERKTGSASLVIEAPDLAGSAQPGDSVTVNGACLTVTSGDASTLSFDVVPQTLSASTLGGLKTGDRVNLERALRLSSRIDGHLVSGHIDGMGTVKQKQNIGNSVIVTIGVPESLSHYMVKKGSVAVDGISLTINDCSQDRFSVAIIPHTAKWTTIGFKNVGDFVNIETDMIGKYVERFLMESQHPEHTNAAGKAPIDVDFLKKTGFLY